jgi:hypothetical protein
MRLRIVESRQESVGVSQVVSTAEPYSTGNYQQNNYLKPGLLFRLASTVETLRFSIGSSNGGFLDTSFFNTKMKRISIVLLPKCYIFRMFDFSFSGFQSKSIRSYYK